MDKQAQAITKLGHSIKNACQMLDISRGTLHRLIRAGSIKVARVGNKVIVPHAELERLVNGELGTK
jgi:excisionase family DNA binding protein